jgi:hypothetical protein
MIILKIISSSSLFRIIILKNTLSSLLYKIIILNNILFHTLCNDKLKNTWSLLLYEMIILKNTYILSLKMRGSISMWNWTIKDSCKFISEKNRLCKSKFQARTFMKWVAFHSFKSTSRFNEVVNLSIWSFLKNKVHHLLIQLI